MLSTPSLSHFKTNLCFQGHKPHAKSQQASAPQGTISENKAAHHRSHANTQADHGHQRDDCNRAAVTEGLAEEPPALSLNDLPPDILRKIAESLQSDDPLIDYLNLSALHATSKAVHAAIKNSVPSKNLKQVLKLPPGAKPLLNDLVEKLPSLSTSIKEHLIHIYLCTDNQRVKSKSIQTFAPQLQHFTERQRQQFIDAAKQIKDNGRRFEAIETLISKISAFTPEQRQQLLDMAQDIKDEGRRVGAVELFILKIGALSPEQRQQLIDIAQGIKDNYYRHKALQIMISRVECFPMVERQQFIAALGNIKSSPAKISTIQILAYKMQYLSLSERQQLVDIILDIKNTRARTEAIQALTPKLPLFSPLQRQQLGKASMLDTMLIALKNWF